MNKNLRGSSRLSGADGVESGEDGKAEPEQKTLARPGEGGTEEMDVGGQAQGNFGRTTDRP